jgi:hypothetical protein
LVVNYGKGLGAKGNRRVSRKSHEMVTIVF